MVRTPLWGSARGCFGFFVERRVGHFRPFQMRGADLRPGSAGEIAEAVSSATDLTGPRFLSSIGDKVSRSSSQVDIAGAETPM